MRTQSRLAFAASFIMMTGAVCYAQSIISAHSGTLHYFQGSVAIDGTPVESTVGKFPEINENSVLSTRQGRAEILLTPGVFLRIGENTSIKMLDNHLMSTRVEFISGSAIVESDDPELSLKEHKVTIVRSDYQIQPLKFGLIEITSEPGQMKVYKGDASVMTASNHTVVKDGHMLPFAAALLSEKFDGNQADDLYLWARDRSAYLSAANMASARNLAVNGYVTGSSYPGLGYSPQFQGGWYLNSALGMYTYMPYAGLTSSPFGYRFFSPARIYYYYSPTPYYWYGGGGTPAGPAEGEPLANLISGSSGAIPGVTSLQPTLASPLRGSSGTLATSGGRVAPTSSLASSAADRAALEAQTRDLNGACDGMTMGMGTYDGH